MIMKSADFTSLSVQFIDENAPSRGQEIRDLLRELGESTDADGQLERMALAAELIWDRAEQRDGDAIPLQPGTERPPRLDEGWRHRFRAELQACLPIESMLWVEVSPELVDRRLNVSVVDKSEWAIKNRGGR